MLIGKYNNLKLVSLEQFYAAHFKGYVSCRLLAKFSGKGYKLNWTKGGWLVGWLVFNYTFSTNTVDYIMRCHARVKYICCRAEGTYSNINKQNEEIHKNTVFNLQGFVEIISSPQIGILGGVFLANDLASTTKPTSL